MLRLLFAQDVQVALDQYGRFAGARPGRHRDVFLDLVGGRGLFRFQFARSFAAESSGRGQSRRFRSSVRKVSLTVRLRSVLRQPPPDDGGIV